MRVSRAEATRTVLKIIQIEVTICIGLSVYGFHKQPESDPAPLAALPVRVQTQEDLPETVNAGLPVRLKIPKISVDAALEQVGLTPQGALGAPKDPANAGWFDQGSRPGDSGNAVIDGHFGYRDHIPAVFDNLHILQPGDPVYTEDEHGVTTRFVVRTTRVFAPDENAATVFRPNDGGEHLNLITCQGTWNENRKSFAGRLVVFADKQDAPPQTSKPAD